MRPPFAYFGGKQQLAAWIVSNMPEHRTYVEPFAGSLAVLLAKPATLREIVNDVDGEIVNFWRVLRDQPDELEWVFMATPHSRAEHVEATYRDDVDDVERARRWWVRVTQSQGQHAKRSGWRTKESAGISVPQYLAAYASRVGPAAARLRHVTVECDDAAAVIERHDCPEAVIYCDPPYVLDTINGEAPGYDRRMTDEAHRRLAETLNGCEGTVLLSGYASALYDELYAGWHVTSRGARSSTATIAEHRQTPRTEVLWSNRPLPQADLFGGAA